MYYVFAVMAAIAIGDAVIAYSVTRKTREFGEVIRVSEGVVGDGRSRTGVRLTRRQLQTLRAKHVYTVCFKGRSTHEEEQVSETHPQTGSVQV